MATAVPPEIRDVVTRLANLVYEHEPDFVIGDVDTSISYSHLVEHQLPTWTDSGWAMRPESHYMLYNREANREVPFCLIGLDVYGALMIELLFLDEYRIQQVNLPVLIRIPPHYAAFWEVSAIDTPQCSVAVQLLTAFELMAGAAPVAVAQTHNPLFAGLTRRLVAAETTAAHLTEGQDRDRVQQQLLEQTLEELRDENAQLTADAVGDESLAKQLEQHVATLKQRSADLRHARTENEDLRTRMENSLTIAESRAVSLKELTTKLATANTDRENAKAKLIAADKELTAARTMTKKALQSRDEKIATLSADAKQLLAQTRDQNAQLDDEQIQRLSANVHMEKILAAHAKNNADLEERLSAAESKAYDVAELHAAQIAELEASVELAECSRAVAVREAESAVDEAKQRAREAVEVTFTRDAALKAMVFPKLDEELLRKVRILTENNNRADDAFRDSRSRIAAQDMAQLRLSTAQRKLEERNTQLEALNAKLSAELAQAKATPTYTDPASPYSSPKRGSPEAYTPPRGDAASPYRAPRPLSQATQQSAVYGRKTAAHVPLQALAVRPSRRHAPSTPAAPAAPATAAEKPSTNVCHRAQAHQREKYEAAAQVLTLQPEVANEVSHISRAVEELLSSVLGDHADPRNRLRKHVRELKLTVPGTVLFPAIRLAEPALVRAVDILRADPTSDDAFFMVAFICLAADLMYAVAENKVSTVIFHRARRVSELLTADVKNASRPLSFAATQIKGDGLESDRQPFHEAEVKTPDKMTFAELTRNGGGGGAGGGGGGGSYDARGRGRGGGGGGSGRGGATAPAANPNNTTAASTNYAAPAASKPVVVGGGDAHEVVVVEDDDVVVGTGNAQSRLHASIVQHSGETGHLALLLLGEEGRWTPAAVTASKPKTNKLRIEIRSFDDEGHLVVNSSDWYDRTQLAASFGAARAWQPGTGLPVDPDDDSVSPIQVEWPADHLIADELRDRAMLSTLLVDAVVSKIRASSSARPSVWIADTTVTKALHRRRLALDAPGGNPTCQQRREYDRWVAKVDIPRNAVEIVAVIHHSMHFITVHATRDHVVCYDSLPAVSPHKRNAILDTWARFVHDRLQWSPAVERSPRGQHQAAGSNDCGLFSLSNAWRAATNKPAALSRPALATGRLKTADDLFVSAEDRREARVTPAGGQPAPATPAAVACLALKVGQGERRPCKGTLVPGTSFCRAHLYPATNKSRLCGAKTTKAKAPCGKPAADGFDFCSNHVTRECARSNRPLPPNGATITAQALAPVPQPSAAPTPAPAKAAAAVAPGVPHQREGSPDPRAPRGPANNPFAATPRVSPAAPAPIAGAPDVANEPWTRPYALGDPGAGFRSGEGTTVQPLAALRRYDLIALAAATANAGPALARLAFSSETRAAHVRWLRLIGAAARDWPTTAPTDAEDTRPARPMEWPAVPFIIDVMTHYRSSRHVKWSTLSTALGSVAGAFKGLPMYLPRIPYSIFLKDYAPWTMLQRAVDAEVLKEPVTQAKAATLEQIVAACDRASPRVAALIALSWVAASRPGDVSQLRHGDVKMIGADVYVTFNAGKTVRLKGERYTVHTVFGMFEPYIRQVWKPDAPPHHFLWYCPDPRDRAECLKELTAALRGIDPELANRSIRRGALQAMASIGASAKTLMEFSGHSTHAMLRRYLGFGVLLLEEGAAQRMAAASALASATLSAVPTA